MCIISNAKSIWKAFCIYKPRKYPQIELKNLSVVLEKIEIMVVVYHLKGINYKQVNTCARLQFKIAF